MFDEILEKAIQQGIAKASIDTAQEITKQLAEKLPVAVDAARSAELSVPIQKLIESKVKEALETMKADIETLYQNVENVYTLGLESEKRLTELVNNQTKDIELALAKVAKLSEELAEGITLLDTFGNRDFNKELDTLAYQMEAEQRKLAYKETKAWRKLSDRVTELEGLSKIETEGGYE